MNPKEGRNEDSNSKSKNFPPTTGNNKRPSGEKVIFLGSNKKEKLEAEKGKPIERKADEQNKEKKVETIKEKRTDGNVRDSSKKVIFSAVTGKPISLEKGKAGKESEAKLTNGERKDKVEVDGDDVKKEKHINISQLELPPHRRRKRRRHSDEERIQGNVYQRRMYGHLLEDVDPSVENSFCVITKKFGKHYVCRFAEDKSLYLFSPAHRLRKFAVYITNHQYFYYFIILTILCNCVTIAMGVNEFDEDGSKYRAMYDIETDQLEHVFLAIYCTEMFLKIISKGFAMNKFAYMRNSWNVIDFVVVSSGILIAVFSTFDDDNNSDIDGKERSGFQVFRVFRVLRAVKTVSVLPGLRTMINALLSGAVQLLEVMALNCSCLLIFALFAMEMYMGKLRQKCVVIPGGPADTGEQTWDNTIDQQKMWYDWVNNPEHWKVRDPTYPKEEYQPCGNDSNMRICTDGYTCLRVGPNFDDGWTSFDDIFLSLLSTFQTLSTDFWERPYELVLSSSGPWSLLFFLVVLFFGSFYLLNLMLAVVAMSYETEAAKKKGASVTTGEKLLLNRASSTFSFEDPYKLNIRLMTRYRRHLAPEKFGRKVNESNSELDSFTSVTTRPNVTKKGLGDTILGIIGRQLPTNDRVSLIKTRAVPLNDEIPKPKENVQKVVAIEIDPKLKLVHSKAGEESELESEDASVYSKEGENGEIKKYPHGYSFILRLESRMRPVAIFIRKKLRPVVSHPMFDAFITFFIITNTLFFALEYHGMPQTMKDVLESADYFFLAVFTAEAVLKLLALQKDYFAVKWNRFDLSIVAISYLSLIIPSNTTYLQSMRLLRIFKLAQSWITMKVLLNIIFQTLGAIGNLVLLLTIVIYIFAILGMQVVGENYSPINFDTVNHMEKFPRWNWNNFWYAFLVVFRIICGEWIELLWECFAAHKPIKASWKCFVIFFPTLIIGNYIVLNLFLALLLESFSTEDLKAAQERELEASGKAQNLKKIVILLMQKSDQKNADQQNQLEVGKSDGASNLKRKQTATALIEITANESLARARFKMATKKVIIKNRVAVAERRIAATSQSRDSSVKQSQSIMFGTTQANTPSPSGGSIEAELLGLCMPKKCLDLNCKICIKLKTMEWKRWDRFRLATTKIVGNPSFEWIVLVLILISSLTLCFEDIHLDDQPNLKETLFYLNCIFCFLFIIEMFLKWFAFGIWPYFKNSWCILDFLIVVISLITLYFDIQVRVENSQGGLSKSYRSNLASLKALRTLRALRPLRAISRWEGMKIVVNALMYAIPLIFNVLLVCLLFWLIFSIMGVQLYKGKFFQCVNNDGERVDNTIVPSKRICCAKVFSDQYSWINIFPNFDNVFQGYLSLFQIATFEGWMELMAAGIDAVDVDVQPIRENQPLHYVFFVVFIVFGAFFTLNLFIGVSVDNFGMLKKKYEGNLIEIFLTPSQRNYLTALKKIGHKKPQKLIEKPDNKFLGVFYQLTMSRRFDNAVFIVIFLNLFVIAFESFEQSNMRIYALSAINSFFTAVYVLECVVKILGLRRFYFTQAWNIFDFVLVMASMLDLIMMNNRSVEFPIPPAMLRIVRVIRIGRVLRLIKSAKGIRKLLNALIVSLPALGNIGALIALITFIYAILGMASFSGVPRFDAVDQVVNWDTFLSSCIVLLRLLLAAGWNDVLDGLIAAPLVCGSYRKMKCGLEGEPDCPHEAIAVGYFVTYILIVFLIIINMYTAIILENYEEASHEEDLFTDDDLEVFYARWARFDPLATQFVGFEQLSDLLASLDPPFCVAKPNIVAIVAFNLPICRGNKIHCLDILHALIKRVVGDFDDNEEFRKLQLKVEQRFQKQFPNRKLLDIISSTRIWKSQQHAATIIQRAWRAYYLRTHPESTLISKKYDRRKNSSTVGLMAL